MKYVRVGGGNESLMLVLECRTGFDEGRDYVEVMRMVFR